MTTKLLLDALIPLMANLSREMHDSERYRRLLDTLRMLFPCDAAALLRLDGDLLVPLAINGLSSDTLGRRFRVSEHPRFRILLSNVPPARSLRRSGRSAFGRTACARLHGLPGHHERQTLGFADARCHWVRDA